MSIRAFGQNLLKLIDTVTNEFGKVDREDIKFNIVPHLIASDRLLIVDNFPANVSTTFSNFIFL